jgi:hypothetical protein
MLPNWDFVKKTTLWQYEDLIKKLNFIKSYPVLWHAYDHDMVQAAVFAHRLFPGINLKAEGYPKHIITTIERLESVGVRNWSDLLSRVSTRAECTAFVSRHDLNFEDFIDVLNYLLRWGFPFQTASRELLEHDDPQEKAFYTVLKQHKLMNSFDFLEQGHTAAGRHTLAENTGLPLGFVTILVHRADIARLPYVGRKTIIPLCGAGYETLARIAAADLNQMESDLEAYFRRTVGKSFDNYKAVIVLNLLVTCAQALPVIMDA